MILDALQHPCSSESSCGQVEGGLADTCKHRGRPSVVMKPQAGAGGLREDSRRSIVLHSSCILSACRVRFGPQEGIAASDHMQLHQGIMHPVSLI